MAKRSRIEKPEHVDHELAKNELDTRADTCCLGRNWRLLSITGQYCDVHGFHSELDAIKDVPVARCATAIKLPSGDTAILIVNEGLYFGGSMEHSLINPNQIRHYGIPVSDDPFDESRDFGIDHEEAFIPFETEGSTVFFDTFVPNDEELEHCRHVVLTDGDSEWDPHTVQLAHARSDGDTNPLDAPLAREVNAVRRENYERHQFECESDVALGAISESLVPDLLYERLIASVRIQRKESTVAVKRATAEGGPTKRLLHRANRSMSKVRANARHSSITVEHIARTMRIGIDKAKQMLKATTQKGVRTAVHPITRRYRVDHLDLHRNKLAGRWYVDWISAGVKSLAQNKGAFVFSNGTYTEVYPCESNNQELANLSLIDFCNDVGVPERLKSDRAPEFCGRGTQFWKTAKRKGCDVTYAEPERKNQIAPVDNEIGELRRRTHNRLLKVPRRLWDFCLVYEAKTRRFIPRDRLRGRTPMEAVTGRTPDISEYCDFEFYDLVWYHSGVHPNMNKEHRALGRWLGVSHRVGSDMCYWILTKSGDVISESTVQHVTRDDTLEADVQKDIDAFNKAVEERLDDTNFHLPNAEGGFTLADEYDLPKWDPAYGDNTPTADEYRKYDENGNPVDPGEPIADADELNDVNFEDAEVYDKYIGAKFLLDELTNNGGNLATVARRATDDYGKPLGRAHANPALDTREYEIELESGETEKIMANQIAANLYSQLDDEGREHLAFKAIVDHRRDRSALGMDNGFITTKGGQRKPKKTTRGWQVLVEFRDETTSWMDMKDVKEASPIELAEYAVANKIDDEPAFAWWVPYVFRKRNRIIAKTKAKYWRTTHKYGVRLPKSVEEALRIDKETGTDYWEKSLNKEMAKAKVSYTEVDGCTPEEVRLGKVPELTGFQEIKCHIIFDVKMNFDRKARFVAGGHMTETPAGICYSSVVSRDSVRLAFLVAAVNDLDILACDIGNAYLNAPCREKIWFEAGPECGRSMQGKVMKLVRALYGLKSSGASWRQMFKAFIEKELGFQPSTSDPDMYYRRNVRGQEVAGQKSGESRGKDTTSGGGEPYYELLLVYVDDVLCISGNPQAVMDMIGKKFEIKNGDVSEPKIYLGADVEKFQLPNGRSVWSMHSKTYVKGAVETVRNLLAEDGRQLKTGKRPHKGPLPHGYKPELDTTDECSPEHTSRFQQLIGILRWAVELGRVDIQVEVAIMSQYQMNPRTGHLEALYLIFHYLWKNPMKRVAFDPYFREMSPATEKKVFCMDAEWLEFYGDVVEEDPPRMPPPLGKPVTITVFVDADHASNVVTRRSHSGVMLFVQNALIRTFSKRQNTVEASTYGSELVAMRIARDIIVEMRIKLKSIGVPIIGPADLLCDNQGVVKNCSIPESTLQKKHNSINYHIVRESAAAEILRVGKEDTNTNLSDALTKLMPYSKKQGLLGNVLYDY